MKKTLAFLMVLVMVLALCACGESDGVIEMINALGEVTLDSESAIKLAEEAYDALSDSDKAKVENYSVLETARDEYNALAEQEKTYNAAVAAMEVEDYEAALLQLNMVAGYKDADDLIAQCTEELAKPCFETDYMAIEGVYVDNSYTCEENENYRFLYVVYSAFTSAENMKIDCKSMNLTINDTNTYKAVREDDQVTYLRNYYNGAYLQTVTIGDTLKFVETFQIPKGELEPGRSVTLAKDQIPQTEEIKFTTDDIVFCDSPEEIAQLADPDGYEEEVWARSDADAEVVSAVKAEINGYQWDVTISPMSYEIEFWAPNYYELRTAFSTADGTYEVKNGYIICTNTIGGITEIPFTYENGVVDVDVIAGLDFNE